MYIKARQYIHNYLHNVSIDQSTVINLLPGMELLTNDWNLIGSINQVKLTSQCWCIAKQF